MQEPKAKERASNQRRRIRAEEREESPAEPASPPEEAVVEEISEETVAEKFLASALGVHQSKVHQAVKALATGVPEEHFPVTHSPVAESDGQVGEHHQVNATALHDGDGIARLVYENEFMDQIIKSIVERGEMDNLAGDIAGKLHDLLANSPEFGQRLINAFMANPQFKGRVVTALIKSLS